MCTVCREVVSAPHTDFETEEQGAKAVSFDITCAQKTNG